MHSRRDLDPLTLIVRALDEIESLPKGLNKIFSDSDSLVSVFQGGKYWYLRFGSHAMARVPNWQDGGADDQITVQVSRAAMSAARLEDIVFSSLAPALRRHGLYMIHAFAARKDDRAFLLVGTSGSGKTTTGLSLVAQGWHYLANDVVLIKEEAGSVIALPTPGGIGLDLNSIELLPDLILPPGDHDLWAKHYYPATTFVDGWGCQAPISHILFPEIAADGVTALRPAPSSTTLARLMEASVDRWDRSGLSHHLRLLSLLSHQANGYDLRLGPQLDQLPAMLRQV